MKEKFVRTTEHKSIEEIANANGDNHISEHSKAILKEMKSLAEAIREIPRDGDSLCWDEIQMASADNESDITTSNAQEIYGKKAK